MPDQDLSAEDWTALLLGRLVFACARLEFEVKLIAMHLEGERASKLSQKDQLSLIRRITKDHSDAAQIETWTHQTNAILRDRGEIVHGSYMGVYEGDGERRGFIAHKALAEVSIDDDRLIAITSRADAAAAQGNILSNKLFDEHIDKFPPPSPFA